MDESEECGVAYYVTPSHLAPGPTPTPPPPRKRGKYSLIDEAGEVYYMDTLITNFLQNSCLDEFLPKARWLLELVGSSTLISELDASRISDAANEVWNDKCCYYVVCATLDEEDYMFIDALMMNSNDHRPLRRMTDMISDPYLPNMLHATTDGKTATTIRACMSIVIAYWIDEAQLSQLDIGYGKDIFGTRIAKRASKRMAPKKVEERLKTPQINHFSYIIESANHVEDLEPLRRQLIEKFGNGHKSIQAILAEAKKELVTVVGINRNYLGYDGGRVKIQITVVNGQYGCALIKRI